MSDPQPSASSRPAESPADPITPIPVDPAEAAEDRELHHADEPARAGEDDEPDVPGDSDETPAPADNVLPYFTPPGSIPGAQGRGLVNLTRLGPMEAEIARTRLEAEGITCFVSDRNTANVYVLAFPDVTLMVHESDVQRAREVLDRPAENPDAPDEDYVDEAWRCPKCHRKTVELEPVPTQLRRLRWTWCALVLIPLAIGILTAVDPAVGSLLSKMPDWLAPIWLAAAVGLGLWVWLRDRGKRCTHCHHEWR